MQQMFNLSKVKLMIKERAPYCRQEACQVASIIFSKGGVSLWLMPASSCGFEWALRRRVYRALLRTSVGEERAASLPAGRNASSIPRRLDSAGTC